MNINRIYFPLHSDEDIKVMEKDSVRNPNTPNLCVVPTQECDVIAPVDELSGNRTNVLTKIVDPNLSPLERDRLLSSLQRIPPSKRHSMSDADLVNMLPSRYNSTLTDNEKYADFIRDLIDTDVNTLGSSDDSDAGVTDDTANV